MTDILILSRKDLKGKGHFKIQKSKNFRKKERTDHCIEKPDIITGYQASGAVDYKQL